MNKKKIAVVALCLCIVSILSMGTLAWFTAEDTINNDFTFVQDFEMDLYETNGKTGADLVIRGLNNKETLGFTYGNIAPGQVLYKDPTVVNKGTTESQWIRVTVTLTNYKKVWKNITNLKATDLFNVSSTKWVIPAQATKNETNDTISWTFYLTNKLQATKSETLFTTMSIPEAVTKEMVKGIGNTVVSIKAEAIQTSNVGSTTCVDAFATVKPTT